MKATISTIIAIFICSISVTGQNLNSFREQLVNVDSLGVGSTISVREDSKAKATTLNYITKSKAESIQGYRVGIFFDNSQQALSKAEKVAREFKDLYPNVPIYITYKNPDFIVTIGNCVTKDEAIILWGRVKSSFPKAYVVNEEIPIVLLGSDAPKSPIEKQLEGELEQDEITELKAKE